MAPKIRPNSPVRAPQAALPQAQKSTQSVWLAEHLRQALLDGRFAPGARLNEVHLSEELRVSRTPVRAALHVLAGERLVQYHANKGFIVRAFPLSEVVVAYEMRALAEGLAARLAAERGLSDGYRQTLEMALAEGDSVLARRLNRETQRAAYARLNETFHSTIHAAASSDLLKQIVQGCQRMPQASAHNVMAFELADVRERHKAHHQIYVAIIGREAQQAESLMRSHVLSVKMSIMRNLAQRGQTALSSPH
jgi:GntR family transcriptional regulator of vanillate catabolism